MQPAIVFLRLKSLSKITAAAESTVMGIRVYPSFGVNVPTLKPGTYAVYVSIGKSDGTPVIALPLTGDDGKHRYKIGQIQVK